MCRISLIIGVCTGEGGGQGAAMCDPYFDLIERGDPAHAYGFDRQLGRLFLTGFPGSVIVSVAETLLKKMKHGGSKDAAKSLVCSQRTEVVPYMHKVTLSLKKVASRFNLPLIFSATNKLTQLSQRTACAEQKGGRKKNREKRFVQCANSIAYEIPLCCGKVYIGQPVGTLPQLREHERSLIIRREVVLLSTAWRARIVNHVSDAQKL